MTQHTTKSTDQHGNQMSGSQIAVDLYDHTLDRLLRYDAGFIELIGRLNEEHPDTAMTHAMTAYASLTSTDEVDVDAARQSWAAMLATPMNERELHHHDAIGQWVQGDWTGVAQSLDDLLERWPTDLLALMIGHQLDFFLGDAANLRDRPGRSLMALDPTHPHHAFVLGMQAFGLEESGDYARAQDSAFAALEVHPEDVWAIHAASHTFEMRGLVDDGIRFLETRRGDWAQGNFFAVHNWWHLALFNLEAGNEARALTIYDEVVHHEDSLCVPIEMVDASALLWRLALDGHDVGDRFSTLADAWSSRATSTPWYAFNDLHAVIALVGASRLPEAEQVVDRLARYIQVGQGTNVEMTALVGLPACRAIIAAAQGRHDDVLAELRPIRRTLQQFGGSHAQRDVLQRTLLEAALRGGYIDLARSLVSERLAVRPSSVYGWERQAAVFEGLGDEVAAAGARRQASAHRTRFANAWIQS